MQLYPCQAVKRHAPALVQAGIGADAAHREVTGGEGLDGHLREVSVPDTTVFRTHLATFRSAAGAIDRGGGVPLGTSMTCAAARSRAGLRRCSTLRRTTRFRTAITRSRCVGGVNRSPTCATSAPISGERTRPSESIAPASRASNALVGSSSGSSRLSASTSAARASSVSTTAPFSRIWNSGSPVRDAEALLKAPRAPMVLWRGHFIQVA